MNARLCSTRWRPIRWGAKTWPKTTPIALAALLSAAAGANPPTADWIFPAGAQRGIRVTVTVGGDNLTPACGFRIDGPGVRVGSTALIDRSAAVEVAADAAPGPRTWRVYTAQGATAARLFVVGELPEVLERADQEEPQRLTLPVTVNGRLERAEDADRYCFRAEAGQRFVCGVMAARLGSPADPCLALYDANGGVLAEADDTLGRDPRIIFTAPATGDYQIEIHNVGYVGGPAHVYRLTVREEVKREGKGERAREGEGARGREGEGARAPLLTAPATVRGRFEGPDESASYRFRARSGERLRLEVVAERLGSPVDTRLSVFGATGEGARGPGSGRAKERGGEVVTTDRQPPTTGASSSPRPLAPSSPRPLAPSPSRPLAPRPPVLASNDDGPGTGTDSCLEFTAPADGEYEVRLEDLRPEPAEGRNGILAPPRDYRLEIAPSLPDFALAYAADAVDLAPGGKATLDLTVRRSGSFAGEIDLVVEGLPAGISVAPLKVPADAEKVSLTFTATTAAMVGPAEIRIDGGADIDGETRRRRAYAFVRPGGSEAARLETLFLMVTSPPRFTIDAEDTYAFVPRGTTHAARFFIKREPGFDADVVLSLADRQPRELDGITGPTLVVPAGQTEVFYPVFLPETVRLNRTSRVLVAGRALARSPEGREEWQLQVSPHQIVMRVQPALLSLKVSPEALEVRPGESRTLTLEVQRTPKFHGAVRAELVLPPDARGITAVPVEIPADGTTITTRLDFAPDADLASATELRLRITGLYNDRPIVAEAPVGVEID